MGQKPVPAGQIQNPAAAVTPAHPFCHLPGFIKLFPRQGARPANCPGNLTKKSVAGEERLLLRRQSIFGGLFQRCLILNRFCRELTGEPQKYNRSDIVRCHQRLNELFFNGLALFKYFFVHRVIFCGIVFHIPGSTDCLRLRIFLVPFCGND